MDETTSTPQQTEEISAQDPAPKKGINWVSLLIILLIPVAFAAGIGLGYFTWGEDAAQLADIMARAETAEQALAGAQAAPANPGNEPQAPPQEQEVRRYEVPVDDDPSIGPEDAVITIVEFSDYQCPYCQRWHVDVFNKIREDYPDQVRFVYRDFPLTSIHPEAVPAAQAANCANEQGAFWEYHEMLFSGQYGLEAEAYIQYATDLELDMESFEACVSSEKYADEVQADYQFAVNLGVQSTPTFFLNGIPIVGAQPYEVFQQVIDLELAGEIPD